MRGGFTASAVSAAKSSDDLGSANFMTQHPLEQTPAPGSTHGISRPLGLPLTRQLLGFFDLRGRHALRNAVSIFGSTLFAPRG